MKKILCLVMLAMIFFSYAVAEEIRNFDGINYPLIREKTWSDDLDGDGKNEEITLWKFSSGGNMGLYCHCLSITKDGEEIFPIEFGRSFCDGKFLFQDIDPRFPGKEIIIFQPQVKGVKIRFYAYQGDRYEIYNIDFTDRNYKEIDIKKIMTEFRRGTKFQRALRTAESFLAALKLSDWKRAEELIDPKIRKKVKLPFLKNNYANMHIDFLASSPPDKTNNFFWIILLPPDKDLTRKDVVMVSKEFHVLLPILQEGGI